MRAHWLLLGLACTACPPPAMNPTPDPLPTSGESFPPPGADAASPAIASTAPGTSGTSGSQPRDAAPPPLRTPNALAPDAGPTPDAAAAVGKFETDDAALKAIGERAQQCAEDNHIALPPKRPLWVRMMLSVGTDGTVKELRLSGTSGLPALDECATSAARAVQFPARNATTWLEAPIGFQASSLD